MDREDISEQVFLRPWKIVQESGGKINRRGEKPVVHQHAHDLEVLMIRMRASARRAARQPEDER